MKKTLIVALVAAVSCAAATPQEEGGLPDAHTQDILEGSDDVHKEPESKSAKRQPGQNRDGSFSFGHAGAARKYWHVKPETTKGAPLIFWLHGRGSSAADYPEVLADQIGEYGYGLVAPLGQCLEDYEKACTRAWNANIGGEHFKFDDKDYLVKLALYMQDKYGYDASRTFVCGKANGGFMSYHLAIEANDVFRAAASQNGLMSANDWAQKETAVSIPIMSVTGMQDSIVPPSGVQTPPIGPTPSLEALIEFWTTTNGTKSSETFKIINGAWGLETLKKHSGGKAPVWDYRIAEGGHESSRRGYKIMLKFFNQFM